MTRCLIVNADDYGRTSEVSRGIREAHLHGIVTSTTALMNMPTVEQDLHIALRETPNLGLGIHLTLTSGQPLLPPEQVPSLIDPSGAFLKLDVFTDRRDALDPAEFKAEWRAQVDRFIAITGRPPTHLDSHHHVAVFTAALFRGVLELAQEYGSAIRLPLAQEEGQNLVGLPPEVSIAAQGYAPHLLAQFRPRCPNMFYATFYDDRATTREILRIIESLPEGVCEVMCHPGYVDAELIASSGYAVPRQTELSVLTDPAVLDAIQRRGIQLFTFAQI